MFQRRDGSPMTAGATPQKYTRIQHTPLVAAGTAGTVAAVLTEHRAVLTVALIYLAIGGGVLVAFDRPWSLAPAWWLFGGLWLALSAPWLAWQYLRSPARFWAAVSPVRAVGAVLVAVAAIPVQVTFQALKQSIGPLLGFPADPWLHQLDVWLHGGPAWQVFQPVMTPGVMRTLDVLYVAWFLGLVGFAFWASWSSDRALRRRALLAFVLLWIGAGTVAAFALPSAGPCYRPEYADLIARLDPDSFARFNQRGIWALHEAQTWSLFAGVSAMPSVHVAVAVFFAIVAWQRSVPLGLLLAVYAVTIQIGSVVLGWHYAIDGYLGAGLAWGAWRLARG